MSSFFNRKISTKTGIIIILLAAGFAGWLIIREYKKYMEIRFTSLGTHYEKKAEE